MQRKKLNFDTKIQMLFSILIKVARFARNIVKLDRFEGFQTMCLVPTLPNIRGRSCVSEVVRDIL